MIPKTRSIAWADFETIFFFFFFFCWQVQVWLYRGGGGSWGETEPIYDNGKWMVRLVSGPSFVICCAFGGILIRYLCARLFHSSCSPPMAITPPISPKCSDHSQLFYYKNRPNRLNSKEHSHHQSKEGMCKAHSPSSDHMDWLLNIPAWWSWYHIFIFSLSFIHTWGWGWVVVLICGYFLKAFSILVLGSRLVFGFYERSICVWYWDFST